MDTAARRANARRAAVMWSLGLAGALGPPAARLQICLGPLAQWVEQRTFNPRVPGSSPGRPTAVRLSDWTPALVRPWATETFVPIGSFSILPNFEDHPQYSALRAIYRRLGEC